MGSRRVALADKGTLPTQTFTVFHVHLSAADIMEINAAGWDSPVGRIYHSAVYKGEYRGAFVTGRIVPVAKVRANGINAVFPLTNTIDGPWQFNEQVTPLGDAKVSARSTSVGDLIRDEAGDLYRVADFGFDLVDDPRMASMLGRRAEYAA